MKYTIIVFFSSMFFVFFLDSCSSCSRSGRAKIIAMARKEAKKKETVPQPNTIIKDIEPKIIKIKDVVTSEEEEAIQKDLIKDKIPPAEGKLIQVEGLVLKEVMQLTIDLKTTSSQINQILMMRNYVFENWHYVFDPNDGHDTWRSAEATLSLKYHGKYSGDCDDYAILLASFARQIGLRSRMVAGYDGDSGHAFAEFLIPSNELNNNIGNSDIRVDDSGRWVSLDWFVGKDHIRFTHNIYLFEDI